MESIAEFLKTKVSFIEIDKGYYIEKVFVVRTHKIESNVQLFSYLSKYPLFGYKSFALVNLAKYTI